MSELQKILGITAAQLLSGTGTEKKAFTPPQALGGLDPNMPPGTAPVAESAMDPAAQGAPVGPMAGGVPPMAPAAAGGMPPPPAPGGGGEQDIMSLPITNLTIGDLATLIGEVVTTAMSGGEAPVGAEGAAPVEEKPKTGTAAIEEKLDQLLSLFGAGAGDPAAAGYGADAGVPMPGAPPVPGVPAGVPGAPMEVQASVAPENDILAALGFPA